MAMNRSAFLILPGLLFLLLAFFLPIYGIVLRSLDPKGALAFASPRLSGENYAEILTDPLYGIVLQNTFTVALVATVLTLLLAYPACYFLSRLPRNLGGRLLLLALFPFWTSILVRLFAFTQILPWFDLLYTSTATIIGMVYYLLPYMIAILYANMLSVDDELLNAARTLGSGPFQTLRRVFVPLTKTGVMAGVTMIFVISLGFFLTPAILGGPQDLTIATYIQQQVRVANWGTAAAMGTILLIITLALFFFANRLLMGATASSMSGGSQKGVARTEPMRLNLPNSIGLVTLVAIFIFLLAPLVVVVVLSFSKSTYLVFPPTGFSLRWYARFFADANWLAAAWLSVKVALATAVLATVFGLLTAVALVRGNLPGRQILTAIFMAPMIVPVILVAVGFYDLASKMRLVGTTFAFITAHTLLALPFTVMICTNALQAIGTELETAARTLGSSPRQAFSAITMRMIAPSLMVSGVFAFVTSWDEPVVALFLSTSSPTLPVHVFNHIQTEVSPIVAVVSTLLMVTVLLVGLLVLLVRAARRRHLTAQLGEGF